MKVGELLKEIKRYKKDYPDLLNYEIFTEQIDERQKKLLHKENKNFSIKDSEDWEYFKAFGYNTIFKDKKIFTINVNY
jgi:hypothetical protein